MPSRDFPSWDFRVANRCRQLPELLDVLSLLTLLHFLKLFADNVDDEVAVDEDKDKFNGKGVDDETLELSVDIATDDEVVEVDGAIIDCDSGPSAVVLAEAESRLISMSP